MNKTNGNRGVTTAPAANPNPSGAPVSLTDRVRSLRLPENSTSASARRTSWLPWVLCAMFALLSGYLGYQNYRSDPEIPTKEEPASAADIAGGAGTAAPVGRV